MLRGIYMFAIYMSFLLLGASAPFIISLGYVWVDTFSPQDVGGLILGYVPVSFVMGVAAVAGFVLVDRHKPMITPLSVVLILFAVWVTFTTSVLAELPAEAWEKWNYAFKSICFAAFIPFVIRSRVHIEAFLQVFLFGTSVHFLPIGIKTVLTGGGYGRELGVTSGNSLLSEGSTIAAVALMLIPIALYLRSNTIILPKRLLTSALYLGFAFAAVAAAIGTYERTGLVGMVVLGIGVWIRSRRKITYGILIAVSALSVTYFTSTAWNARISTITSYNTEGSALSRILVWKWTLGYVSTHPFGGGFNDYKVDKIVFPPGPDGKSLEREGVAFHSIYFEVLGEQGYLGLAIYLMIIAISFYNLQRAAWRIKKGSQDQWVRDLAYALQVSLATLLVCGSFIGIAFQPMLYYLFAISACLWLHVRSLSAMPQILQEAHADPSPSRIGQISAA